LTATQTITVNPAQGTVFTVADPALSGKQALVIQGTSGNDTVAVVPGKTAGIYLVTLNGGTVQTFTGVTGRILAFGLDGNDSILLKSTVKAPALLVAGSGNTTLTGGAGKDTLVAGAGDDSLDGGRGVNTLVASGDVDFTLKGGTSRADGSLTGLGTDVLVRSHIQLAQLTLTGPDSHTIDATAFAGKETLTAGSGDDVLKAGAGNDVLVGGTGNDSLVGGAGKSLLIAGSGAATALVGGTRADLLIAGSTNFDHNLDALNAIMAEWTSASSYTLRLAHLMNTTPGGKNGSTFLTPATVHDNTSQDTLIGGLGQDWFWARQTGDSLPDVVTTGKLAETVTVL
jgi:Ca2+-binding RTX toxin-like protein